MWATCALAAALSLANCNKSRPQSLEIATTSSVQNSGLLDALPDGARRQAEALRAAPAETSLAACRELLRAWPFDRDRVRPALGPTIPLHCSDEFLVACRDLARDHDVVGRLAVCELILDPLIAGVDEGSVVVRDVPRYPPVRRDLAFVLPEEVAAGDVVAAIEEAAGELFARSMLFDVYRGDPLPPGAKSLAFAIDLRASDRTLTGEETEPVVTAIVERLRREFGAELRSG